MTKKFKYLTGMLLSVSGILASASCGNPAMETKKPVDKQQEGAPKDLTPTSQPFNPVVEPAPTRENPSQKPVNPEPAEEEVEHNYNITPKAVEFVNVFKQINIPDKQTNIYNVEGFASPYVEFTEMFLVVHKLMGRRGLQLENDKKPNTWTYKIEHNGDFSLNWKDNTITFNDSNIFDFKNQDPTNNFKARVQVFPTAISNLDASPTVLNLSNYGIKMIHQNGKTYVPLWLFNLLICSPTYYNLYYNGSQILGQYFGFTDTDPVSAPYRKNQLNNTAQTPEMRLEVYNQLRFIFENFYGLREFKGFTNFEEYIGAENKASLLSTDINENTKALVNILHGKLRDLHTSYIMPSFYNDPSVNVPNFIENTMHTSLIELTPQLGENAKRVNQFNELKKAADQANSANHQKYGTYNLTFYGNTAFIKFDTFLSGSNVIPGTGQIQDPDTYFLFLDSMQRIQAYNKEVETGNKNQGINGVNAELALPEGSKQIKNIVINLSMNLGGSVTSMDQALGFLTNQEIRRYSYNVLDKVLTQESFKVDANGDGQINDKDVYPGFNWVVLAGNNSFSSANTFTALAKHYKLGKIIGQTTGGGMANIVPIVLSDGTTFQMSSNTTQVVLGENQKPMGVEGGITPDIEVPYDKFFDYQYLDNLINENSK
ncbi:S41 family peptidase [Mycoplasma nasistruthionis]|uniref:Tail specific protease domain-containing protein n=1 Tax=Mycoplasma nasistruthionis TaxID=353852 RepID=A0A4Y6I774_9MOLU|nr:S41 family peptidase [Mycoplasma nasistruthionis]QDF65242.1 hypothetical protein FIV53_03060 [Mycoplasma nasistruthionis]